MRKCHIRYYSMQFSPTNWPARKPAHRPRSAVFAPNFKRFQSSYASKMRRLGLLLLVLTMAQSLELSLGGSIALGSEASKRVERTYPIYPPAPSHQSIDQAKKKTQGCLSCHRDSDAYSMHDNPGVVLGCTDCHGGDASVYASDDSHKGGEQYRRTLESAHVLPRYPEDRKSVV